MYSKRAPNCCTVAKFGHGLSVTGFSVINSHLLQLFFRFRACDHLHSSCTDSYLDLWGSILRLEVLLAQLNIRTPLNGLNNPFSSKLYHGQLRRRESVRNRR